MATNGASDRNVTMSDFLQLKASVDELRRIILDQHTQSHQELQENAETKNDDADGFEILNSSKDTSVDSNEQTSLKEVASSEDEHIPRHEQSDTLGEIRKMMGNFQRQIVQKMDRLEEVFTQEKVYMKDQLSEAQQSIQTKLESLGNIPQLLTDVENAIQLSRQSRCELCGVVKALRSDVDRLMNEKTEIPELLRECRNVLEDITTTRQAHSEAEKLYHEACNGASCEGRDVSLSDRSLEEITSKLEDLRAETIKTRDALITSIEESQRNQERHHYRLQRDVTAVVVKEGQLVREHQAGELPARDEYVYDFYVEDFTDLIGSGQTRYGMPWSVGQLKSSLQACVEFLTDSEMEVSLICANQSEEMGLPTLQRAVNLQVRATLIGGAGMGNIFFGTVDDQWDPAEVRKNWGWSLTIARRTCEDLAKYCQTKGHRNKAVLIRFELKVLD